MREVAAQFERPVLLFSGGKDSILMVHLARKAFSPAKIPFPLVHVDTGHNFPETLEFRDRLVQEVGATLHAGSVQASIDSGKQKEEEGLNPSRNRLQILTLLETLDELKADAALGGGRRDEEKARAKERFFSHRDRFGQWDPKNQRPEIWDLYNGRKSQGEHFRVFPISNWTELDVWTYLKQEKVELPSLYFSHERKCYQRDGVWYAHFDWIKLKKDEKVVKKTVRFRSIGDVTCTGAYESDAKNIDDIIAEVASATSTERGTRGDDKKSDSSMEDRKQQGYF